MGREKEALEEAMHQPVRACWKAEQALAGLLLERAGPRRELVVAERINVRPTRQIGQRLFVGDHDIARLHPWDIELMRGAELAERQQRTRDAASGQSCGEVIERAQCVKRHQRLQLAVQPADDIYRVHAGLSLCLYAPRNS